MNILRSDMHRILSVAVVLIWLGMVGALAAKTRVPAVEEPVAHVDLPGRDSWMGIYLEGAKVGWAHQLTEKTPGGYTVTEEVYAALTVMETRQVMRVETVSRLDEEMSLTGFGFTLRSGLADMKMTGGVSGGVLGVVVETAGRAERHDIPLDGPINLASDLELALGRGGLYPGRRFRMPFFDPASLSTQHMDVEVEAVEELKLGGSVVPVYRVRQDYADVSVTSWINPELGTIKAEGLMGFTFLLETREVATSRPEGGYQSADITALVSVPADGELSLPRDSSYLRAELTGAPLDGLELSGERQSLEGRVVTIRRERTDALAGYAIPFAGDGMDGYMGPSPFMQSDDPVMAAKAREVVGGEKDALRAAERLSGWVYENVEKRPSAGIPSAVEVLDGMQGDCNEHTVLYVALARSVGIPARMAAGIVMMEGRFYYHAWPEVYVGGWVSLDPTFGQFPADATHIKMVEGGPDKQVAILKLIGKLKVRILEHG